MSAPTPDPATAPGSVEIVHGDSLDVARALPDGSFTLVYLDPPFNTGRTRERHGVSARRADRPADRAPDTTQENLDPADPRSA